MKFNLLTFAASTLFALDVLAQMQISTPGSLVECQPVLLSWSEGQSPYFLSVDPGNQPGAAALEQLGEQSSTSFVWLVNIQANTLVGFTVRDSTGATAQTAAVTIQDSGDRSCVGKAISSGGGSAAATGGSSPTSKSSDTATSSSQQAASRSQSNTFSVTNSTSTDSIEGTLTKSVVDTSTAMTSSTSFTSSTSDPSSNSSDIKSGNTDTKAIIISSVLGSVILVILIIILVRQHKIKQRQFVSPEHGLPDRNRQQAPKDIPFMSSWISQSFFKKTPTPTLTNGHVVEPFISYDEHTSGGMRQENLHNTTDTQPRGERNSAKELYKRQPYDVDWRKLMERSGAEEGSNNRPGLIHPAVDPPPSYTTE
ncbi:hypothetical protein VKT23_019342 [Stygiomarasmius scandens]|uniref:Mid2 domain-containing protein n=1 Tax=Marasmiellus scandens TaxID=2682957 RepID=A0ABR1ILU3_9AGAR